MAEIARTQSWTVQRGKKRSGKAMQLAMWTIKPVSFAGNFVSVFQGLRSKQAAPV